MFDTWKVGSGLKKNINPSKILVQMF